VSASTNINRVPERQRTSAEPCGTRGGLDTERRRHATAFARRHTGCERTRRPPKDWTESRSVPARSHESIGSPWCLTGRVPGLVLVARAVRVRQMVHAARQGSKLRQPASKQGAAAGGIVNRRTQSPLEQGRERIRSGAGEPRRPRAWAPAQAHPPHACCSGARCAATAAPKRGARAHSRASGRRAGKRRDSRGGSPERCPSCSTAACRRTGE